MIVLLVVADSLRADAPSFAGGPAQTPLLDGLASGGSWFPDLFASGGSTVPALMAMLTGTFPHLVGVGRWNHPFPARRPALTTAFAAAGFSVRCFHPYPSWGFVNVPGAGKVGDSQDAGAVVEALSAPGDDDRFVLVHHWWTHLPYLTHSLPFAQWHRACDFALESLGRYPRRIAPQLRRSYLRTVRFLSEELLGRYLDAATARGRQVLLALVGDHGENWGEALPPGRRVQNVYDLHGRWLADCTVRVPLLLWGAGRAGAVPARGRQDGLVRGVDVGPTIAELAGVSWPGPLPEASGPEVVDRGLGPGEEGGRSLELSGRSVAAWVLGGPPSPAAEALVATTQNAYVPGDYPAAGPVYWRTLGLRTGRGWVVWDGVGQELEVRGHFDPGEADEIRTRLEAERLRALDSGPPIPEPDLDRLRAGGVEGPVAQRLRTLGYLG